MVLVLLACTIVVVRWDCRCRDFSNSSSLLRSEVSDKVITAVCYIFWKSSLLGHSAVFLMHNRLIYKTNLFANVRISSRCIIRNHVDIFYINLILNNPPLELIPWTVGCKTRRAAVAPRRSINIGRCILLVKQIDSTWQIIFHMFVFI